MLEMVGRIPPWTDLPLELLLTIVSCLSSNPIDIIRFRAVCKSWYSLTASLPTSLLFPQLPLRLPRPSYYPGYSALNFSILSATAVYALHPKADNGSSSTPATWLLFVDQLHPDKLSIRIPFTQRSFSLPLDFPSKLNMIDFRASKIGMYYNLSSGLTRPSGELFLIDGWSGEVVKVILLSNGSIVAICHSGKLSLFRFGVEKNVMDGKWEIIHDGKRFRLDDIVEYKGSFLAIDRRARVYEMSDDFLRLTVIVPSITGGGGRRKRLVESSGILYLVVRCDVSGKPEHMGNIRVYELNENIRKWVEVKSIGDEIFFFGLGFSFSASVQECEGFCGKNCILYGENSFNKYANGGYYGDSWLFYGSDHRFPHVAVYHLEEGARIHAMEPYSCCSDILWPPPSWIWPDNITRYLGTLEATVDRLLTSSSDDILKAKYKELCSLVGVLFSGEGPRLQEVLNINYDEIDIYKKFMSEIELEIGKEFKSIEARILNDEDSMRLRHFAQLSNQIEISDDEAQDGFDCAHCLHKPIRDSTLWLSREVQRRLSTHIELSASVTQLINALYSRKLS